MKDITSLIGQAVRESVNYLASWVGQDSESRVALGGIVVDAAWVRIFGHLPGTAQRE